MINYWLSTCLEVELELERPRALVNIDRVLIVYNKIQTNYETCVTCRPSFKCFNVLKLCIA